MTKQKDPINAPRESSESPSLSSLLKNPVTRREFVKNAAGGAIGVAIMGLPACAGDSTDAQGDTNNATKDTIDTGTSVGDAAVGDIDLDTLETTDDNAPQDLSDAIDEQEDIVQEDMNVPLATDKATVFEVTDIPELDPELPPPPAFHHPGVDTLLALMGTHGLKFHQGATTDAFCGPAGIIAAGDVVIIKVNSQWRFRGSTSTDLLRGLIQRILDHPDGFTGEIAVCDNRQDFFLGGPTEKPNSINPEYTLQYVVDLFGDQVSLNMWEKLNETHLTPDDFSQDGYVYLDDEPGGTPYCSYPRFTTPRGTKVDLAQGIYTGSGFEKRLRIINLPVLKTHLWFGGTAATKNYYGVLATTKMGDERYDNIHAAHHSKGLTGSLMKEIGVPDLSIVDCLNPVVQPPFGPLGEDFFANKYGGDTYKGILVASQNPVALDYYAFKHILYATPVAAPCSGLLKTYTGGTNPSCVPDPPCVGNPGFCERSNPDLVDPRKMDEAWTGGFPIKVFTVDGLHQSLLTASQKLYNSSYLSDDVIELITQKCS